jgi:UPF0755 protein
MRKNRTERLLRAAFGAALAGIVLFGAASAWYVTSDLPAGLLPLQFDIQPGSSLRGAARQMKRAGVLDHARPFIAMARLLGEAGNIKAGNYEIAEPVTPYRLLRKITAGEVTQVAITFVEGWTFRQIRQALEGHPGVSHATSGLTDQEILQRLKIAEPSPEGLFFPDTYHFASGSSDLRILRRAYRLMHSRLQAQWDKRPPDLPIATAYEGLILASIVEKETGREDERELVAAVFLNRLRKGMPLQADPTVIYGMGDAFDGNLRKRDLLADTPYNTYLRPGLPPTPIAIPGRASLAAALSGPQSDAFYFVSKGDGSSHFSRTLGEHERAVTKYQRPGRR